MRWPRPPRRRGGTDRRRRGFAPSSTRRSVRWPNFGRPLSSVHDRPGRRRRRTKPRLPLRTLDRQRRPHVASGQDEPTHNRLPEPAPSPRLEPANPDTAGLALETAAESTLEAIAHLCTEFGRAVDRSDIQQLVQEAAAALNATGLVVWHWDEVAGALKPALVHGYSERVLAHLPVVRPDADNVTAASFRSANTCEIAATAHTSGALVIPLLVPEGCAGVLALEIPEGVRPTRSARAAAALLAAALAQLLRRSGPPEVKTQARSA